MSATKAQRAFYGAKNKNPVICSGKTSVTQAQYDYALKHTRTRPQSISLRKMTAYMAKKIKRQIEPSFEEFKSKDPNKFLDLTKLYGKQDA